MHSVCAPEDAHVDGFEGDVAVDYAGYDDLDVLVGWWVGGWGGEGREGIRGAYGWEGDAVGDS